MTADTLLRVNAGVRRYQRPSNPTLVPAQTAGGAIADLPSMHVAQLRGENEPNFDTVAAGDIRNE